MNITMDILMKICLMVRASTSGILNNFSLANSIWVKRLGAV